MIPSTKMICKNRRSDTYVLKIALAGAHAHAHTHTHTHTRICNDSWGTNLKYRFENFLQHDEVYSYNVVPKPTKEKQNNVTRLVMIRYLCLFIGIVSLSIKFLLCSFCIISIRITRKTIHLRSKNSHYVNQRCKACNPGEPQPLFTWEVDKYAY